VKETGGVFEEDCGVVSFGRGRHWEQSMNGDIHLNQYSQIEN